MRRINTDRNIFMYIILNIVTCGIYGYYFVYTVAQDVNEMCRGDGETTQGPGMYILLSIVTCGFYSLFWEYKLANRLQANAPKYGLNFSENGTTVLMWYLIGLLVCGIGPYVAMYFIINNTNRLAVAYNQTNGL